MSSSLHRDRARAFGRRHVFHAVLFILTVTAFLLRLPYWDVIPPPFDEVEQAVHALFIAQGRHFPLVGNDAYAGPFFFYVLAALIRLGVTDPLVGRVVTMVAGTLTVPVTYAWVAALGKDRAAGFLAAAFVALNPALILVNSHIGGVTLLLPFFTVLFLWLLVEGLKRDRALWMGMAGIAAGLALQSNLVVAPLVVAALAWFLLCLRRRRQRPRPLAKPVLAFGLMLLIVISPVVVHNLTAGFETADHLEEKSYLWQADPTWETVPNNVRRLSLQAARQVGGVLSGDETIGALLGTPLLYAILMVAGLAHTTLRRTALPLASLAPYWVLLPVFSSHYGFLTIGRFTTHLVPVWAAVLAFALLAVYRRGSRGSSSGGTLLQISALLLTLTLLLSLPSSMFRYYGTVLEERQSGRSLLGLSRHVVKVNAGEPVYISTNEELSFLSGIPYVPSAAFLLNDIQHEFLPPRQIIGRLYANPHPSFLLLSDADASIVRRVAPLERVDVAANDLAAQRQYGLYRYAAEAALPRPSFVLHEDQVDPPGPRVLFEEGVLLLGCTEPRVVLANAQVTFDCYWQKAAEMPRESYVTFAHLMAAPQRLVAQDDHGLGREQYPLDAWQADDVVVEQYTLSLPEEVAPGRYSLQLGVYVWPNLQRLNVPGSDEDVVELGTVDIAPVP